MRKIFPILIALCFACIFAHADDAFDTARAAARPGAAATPSATAQQRGQPAATPVQRTQPSPAPARGTGATTAPRETPPVTTGERAAIPIVRTPTTQQRAATIARQPVAPGGARTAIAPAQATTTPSRAATSMRAAATIPTMNNARSAAPARAAMARNAVGGVGVPGIDPARYRNCRTVFFDCMDEFCANKNAQLRRCACSSRVREFDAQRAQLDRVSDQMTDFNARLLTVAMDREDAAAILRATEGEQAFHGTTDKTASQGILDTIMNRLRTTTEDESMGRSLAAINLSMDFNAFDTIDFMMGAEMTTKEGEALYRAALPVCREMALEVCDPADIPTVQSAYQMAIEQDCNAVAKTYAGLTETARERTLEAGALLDMSRLANFQTRNADDILACKKKMLDMLADNAVCGPDLGKCLDWSGKYINPGTGEAILTPDLYRLAEMLHRPTGDNTWARTPGNERFVQFLNSKRAYIEPAMKNCEQIGPVIWDMFIEDALAQIMLAQGRKLESMRQSCTTLTTDCLTATMESLVNFDARALSVFGLSADRAANEICAEIKNSCVALLESTAGETMWGEAMTDIAVRKSYESMLLACGEIGRNCIVQNCTNINGKFGLCMNKDSPIRGQILSGNLCWQDVVNCVSAANEQTRERIITTIESFATAGATAAAPYPVDTLVKNFDATPIYYRILSGSDMGKTLAYPGASAGMSVAEHAKDIGIWLNCRNNSVGTPSATNPARIGMDTCRIAESIWGNCTEQPMRDSNDGKIINDGEFSETLLAWLGRNTNNINNDWSCIGYGCQAGHVSACNSSECVERNQLSTDGHICSAGDRFNVFGMGAFTNCCTGGKKFDSFGNCCDDGEPTDMLINLETTIATASITMEPATGGKSRICNLSKSSTPKFVAKYQVNNTIGTENLFCLGTWNPDTAHCSGRLFVVNSNGQYSPPMAGYGPTSGAITSWNPCQNGICPMYFIGEGECNSTPGTACRPQITSEKNQTTISEWVDNIDNYWSCIAGCPSGACHRNSTFCFNLCRVECNNGAPIYINDCNNCLDNWCPMFYCMENEPPWKLVTTSVPGGCTGPGCTDWRSNWNAPTAACRKVNGTTIDVNNARVTRGYISNNF
ncbi:MAG: hypothetical protein FWE52_00290 [Alphaproteobacteria bacterium]|nr:hypothetical protein [Alphaproteobacteria bacterium]